MSDKYHYLVGADEAMRAGHTIEAAANSAQSAAESISSSVQSLRQLCEGGYGGPIAELLELLRTNATVNAELLAALKAVVASEERRPRDLADYLNVINQAKAAIQKAEAP